MIISETNATLFLITIGLIIILGITSVIVLECKFSNKWYSKVLKAILTIITVIGLIVLLII